MAILCDILNTGSELVLGRTLNRHGAWFGQKLFDEGIQVRRALVLPDGPIIQDELARSLKEADMVLVTGGLGPTTDDLSRDYVSACLGVGMDEDPATMERIRSRLAARGRTCSEAQRRQAMVPAGASILPNDRGTAPGLAFVGRVSLPGQKARLLCLLPGPPGELHPMFLEQVIPLIREIFVGETRKVSMKEFHFAGIGEGELAARVEPLLGSVPGLEIGYCAHNTGTMELRLLGSEDTLAQSEAALKPILGPDFFSAESSDLAALVLSLLHKKHQHIALAESCTGGAVASRLTDIAGASEVFEHGVITYANSAKIHHLGLSHSILENFGAVSAEVAAAMAEGVRAVSGAEHGLALTGIAGPGGGSEAKPVGTLWLGLASKGHSTLTVHHRFLGDRDTFKRLAVTYAFDLIRRRLEGLV